ncbi:hypothetical protein AAIR98_001653 [Elusimicrobium simillimum]|uniref:hypothetical protein n=1 Tax=Elusimicrobium simillimum TaxID=3143438 RepID=UPI003C6F35E3
MTKKLKGRLVFFIISLLTLAAAVSYVYYSKQPKGTIITFEEEPADIENSQYAFTGEVEAVEPDSLPFEPESTASAFENTNFDGVAEKNKSLMEMIAENEEDRRLRPVYIESLEMTPVPQTPLLNDEQSESAVVAEMPGDEELAQTRSVSMLTAPVDYKIIRTTAEYNKFKTAAKGKYPAVDFNKNAIVVLESKSNLPDNIFEITESRKEDGKDIIDFRVNIFGLDKRTHSHTYKVVGKNIKTVTLNQIL